MDDKNLGPRVCGIQCECVNCRYHAKDNTCHAGSVKVGSHDAIRCGETCCETFSSCGSKC